MAAFIEFPDGFSADLFSGESERGCVLAAHAFLDEQLKCLFRIVAGNPAMAERLVSRLLRGGGVGKFQERVEAALKLGLIGEGVATLLRGLNKLRNDFAHNPAARELSNEKVENIWKSLVKAARENSAGIGLHGMFGLLAEDGGSPRSRFVGIMLILFRHFDGVIRSYSQPERRPSRQPLEFPPADDSTPPEVC
jgi:hypothetical protein